MSVGGVLVRTRRLLATFVKARCPLGFSSSVTRAGCSLNISLYFVEYGQYVYHRDSGLVSRRSAVELSLVEMTINLLVKIL